MTSNVPQDDCTASEKHLATAETNLVASSSDSPIVVFQAHQSGINDIAISSHGNLLNACWSYIRTIQPFYVFALSLNLCMIR